MSLESDITEAMRLLLKVRSDIEGEAKAIVKDVAVWMKDETKARVPIDEGNIEDAITYRVWNIKDGASAAVYVDPEASGGEDGVKPSVYAEWLHEGSYELGDGSNRKQIANPGVRVGNKFLERALDENESDVKKYVLRRLREVLNE